MTEPLRTIQYVYQSAGLDYDAAVKGAEFILRHYRPLRALGPSLSHHREGLLLNVNAMLDQVASYPDGGDLYAALLAATYVEGETPSESDLLEAFHLSRSTYYRRKKEAIALFALALYNRL